VFQLQQWLGEVPVCCVPHAKALFLFCISVAQQRNAAIHSGTEQGQANVFTP